MRPIKVALVLGLSGFALPALAQIERLPETSRSEAQAGAISRSLDSEGRSRASAQQNQFEVNSLRTQDSIRSVAPPVVAAPPIAGPTPVVR